MEISEKEIEELVEGKECEKISGLTLLIAFILTVSGFAIGVLLIRAVM